MKTYGERTDVAVDSRWSAGSKLRMQEAQKKRDEAKKSREEEEQREFQQTESEEIARAQERLTADSRFKDWMKVQRRSDEPVDEPQQPSSAPALPWPPSPTFSETRYSFRTKSDYGSNPPDASEATPAVAIPPPARTTSQQSRESSRSQPPVSQIGINRSAVPSTRSRSQDPASHQQGDYWAWARDFWACVKNCLGIGTEATDLSGSTRSRSLVSGTRRTTSSARPSSQGSQRRLLASERRRRSGTPRPRYSTLPRRGSDNAGSRSRRSSVRGRRRSH